LPCALLSLLPVFITGRQICAGTVAFSSLMPITAAMLMVLFLRRAKSSN